MLRLKIVTYTPEFINKVNIESLTLLTKDGERVSLLTPREMRIAEGISLADASRRTFLIDGPIISCTDEYDEEAVLDMLENASVLYGDITYNEDALFADETWIEEISLRSEDRYAKIDRPVKRNFWNSAFIWFKKEQRFENRDFNKCYHQAVESYMGHAVEDIPTEYDTDDMLNVARAIAADVWDGYDRWNAAENL